MRALVFCLVALAAYKAQGLILSKPNRNIESAAAAIAAAAMKEGSLSDISASGESNHTKENQSRIEKVASNMIRGLLHEAEYLKNETMNILTKYSSNATRLNYNQALKTLIAIKNMTETANALIIKVINDMEKKAYTIKNQTIEEIQSKSQNLTLTFHEDVRKAIEKMELMNKTAHEIIDESILTLQTEGESIKNKTIDEMELASKNLTSMYQKSVEEARQTINDMKKSLQKLVKNLIEAARTEGIAFQKDTIEAIKLQANNITEMFHKNINETMVQVDIAIKQKNEQALATIEEVRKTTSSALYKEAEGVRKNFSDHLHDVQQGLQTTLDLKVQQINGNVVEKIESAINKLEHRETQLESNLDLKKKEIVEELEKKNNKTKFEEELKSVENSFMNSVNKKFENSEESFLKKFISAITETTQSRAKVFEGTLSNEVKEYNRLLKKNKALYMEELEKIKESIEAALRIVKGSSTDEGRKDTVKIEVDASKAEIKENNNKHTKENVVTKTQESTTGNSITVSENKTVVSKEQQTVCDLTKIEKKSNVSASTDKQINASESEIGKTVILNGKKGSYSERVLVKSSNESSIIGTTGAPEVNTRPVEKNGSSASSVSSESSSNKTEEAKIETVSPMSDETHGRKNYTVTTITTVTKTVSSGGENENTTTSTSSKNITLLSGDKTPATLEHSQIDLKTNATATSTTETAKIESTTEAKTAETTTVASVDNIDPAKNATEKPVEVDLQTTEKISVQFSNESLIVGTTEATEVNTRPVEKDSLSTSVSSEISSNKTEKANIESVAPMNEETHGGRKKITTVTKNQTVIIEHDDDSAENKNATTLNSSKNITLSSDDNTSTTSEHSQIDLKNSTTATSTTETAKIESITEAKTSKTTKVDSVDNVEPAKNATEKTVEVDRKITERILIQSSNESSLVSTTEAAKLKDRFGDEDSSKAASDNLTTKSNETVDIIPKPGSEFFDRLINNTTAIVSEVTEEKKETLSKVERFPQLDVDLIDAGSLTDEQLIKLGKQAISYNDSVGV